MSFPQDIALGLQRKLHFIYDSSCYAIEFVSGLADDYDDLYRWQVAVDALYVFIKGGVLCSPHVKDEGEGVEYVRGLSKINPFSYEEENWIEWHVIDIFLTNEVRHMIEKYQIQRSNGVDVLCRSFMEELELFVESNGVAWSGVPLIPVAK